MRFVGLLLAAVLLAGCAGTKALFTEPTGRITIERQEFIDTYATIRVLYKRVRAEAGRYCQAKNPEVLVELGRINCGELADIDKKARALNVQIEKKIEVPESQIDWAVVKDLLGALVSLVP